MILLAIAIAPGIAIALYYFFRDQYNREPRRHLLISFFLGMISAVLAGVIEQLLFSLFKIDNKNSIPDTLLSAYIFVGLIEEWTKYVMVRGYAFRKPEFDEPLDGIIYTIMVGMGFATLENIAYVLENGIETAIMRMFLSVPAHASFAVIMGYFLGKAKFAGPKRFVFIVAGLFWAAFWHGSYDFFLFLQENITLSKYVPHGLLFLGAVASFIWASHLSRKAMKEHLDHSRQVYDQNGL